MVYIKHGAFSKNVDRLVYCFYNVWHGMIGRCKYKNRKDYHNYGGRGIVVCKRWQSFENFKEDMWEEYKSRKSLGEIISLDRIDVSGNYVLSNCKWSTIQEQARNLRCSAKTQNYKEWRYIKHKISTAILSALKKNEISYKYEKYLGCTIKNFRKYIKSKFKSGMTWNNNGLAQIGKNHWHLDHIIPLSKFDLTKESQCYKAYNYKNCQPLWWMENSNKKRTDYDY